MPSSPKLFHARSWSALLRFNGAITLLTVASVCVAGLFFSIGFVFRSTHGLKCREMNPRSMSVFWERKLSGQDAMQATPETAQRHKVMGFVGINTGFSSHGRRKSLRKTWMPSDPQSLQRLEEATGLAIRFIIGRTSDKRMMSELKEEMSEYDDFILLDIEEEYRRLPHKTLAFFKAAFTLYDSEFYVKADDDIYLRPDRLSLLLAKERSHSQTYIGCMKKGPVFTDLKFKWYEPLSHLLGKDYFLHAYGPIYALSSDVVATLAALPNNSFRMFSNEDVTIGAWMLAMDVHHENSHALCEASCSLTSIAVWDIPKCSGLCSPEKRLLELHAKDECSRTPTLPNDD